MQFVTFLFVLKKHIGTLDHLEAEIKVNLWLDVHTFIKLFKQTY